MARLQRLGRIVVLLPGVLSGCGNGAQSCPSSAPCDDASAIGAAGFGQGGVAGVSTQTGGSAAVSVLTGGSGAIGGTANGGATSAGAAAATGGSANGGTAAGGTAATGGTPPVDAGASTTANGMACKEDSACQSAHCSSGVCCESACSDRFFSCNVDGHVGACTPVTSVYIDPLNGHDDASGTVNDPLKTLKTALSVAKSGWTLYLKPGTFGRSSGEDWSTKVPDGVAVQAVVEGNAVLAGGDNDTGLEFAGAGTATGITFRGFATAVKASGGKVSIARCTVDRGGGVDLSGSVTATLEQVVLGNLDAYGVRARDSANVTMTGGSIGGIGYVAECRGAEGVSAYGAATVRLSGVSIHDFGGDGVNAGGTARVSIERGSIVKTGQSDCVGAQVTAAGSSVVQLKSTPLSRGNSVGAFVRSSANLSLDDVSIDQNPFAGVEGDGGSVHISGGSIRENGYYGIELMETCGAEVTDTELVSNQTSIYMQDTASLRLRGTNMYDDKVGIDDRADGLNIDLGTVIDPGMNSIQASDNGLLLRGSSAEVTINAVGNKWNANVQAADATGAYASQILDCPCSGTNLSAGKVHIQL
jgi:hypothetical protein